MRQRIGVYICHCGGNISDYVDVEELSKMFHKEDGVVVSKDVMFACADSNQKAMVEDINQKITAVLMRAQIPVREPEQVRQAAAERRSDYSKYRTQKADYRSGNDDVMRQDTRERQVTQPIRAEKTVGRNDPCPCGSGKKYKNCCGR